LIPSAWQASATSMAYSAKMTGSLFTGGGVALAQYSAKGFDADLRC